MATTGWSRSSTSDGVRIMKILVTNDDGIDSPGIRALADAVSRVGEVLFVAPDKEQSGVGTAVSFHNSIAVAERTSSIEGARAYAVSGTPTGLTQNFAKVLILLTSSKMLQIH